MYQRSKSLTKPKKCVSSSCHRCGGSGIVPPWGECFRCGGNGRDPSDLNWAYPADWSDEQCAAHVAKLDEKNAAARAKAAAKRQAASDAVFAENAAAYPALAEAEAIQSQIWDNHPNHNREFDDRGDFKPDEAMDRAALDYERHNPELPPFVRDILSKARKFQVSEKQAAAVARAVEQHKNRAAIEAARMAAAKPVPAGRVEIEGVIVSIKKVESRFGMAEKMLVKGDGWKVYGTVPAGAAAAPGASIRFKAEVKPSADDPSFGFFSRPRTIG